MKKQPVRVGFDLDGVLLYNPARIVRPMVASVKHAFMGRKPLHFYYPVTDAEKALWHMFHLSSIFLSPGIRGIRSLVEDGTVEAYIVTARYDFIGRHLKAWARKRGISPLFTDIIHNAGDEQPHLFKERIIRKLGLRYFVEDNYDIVNYLKKSPIKVAWIYNIFDSSIPYPYRFPNLEKAVAAVSHDITGKP